MIHQLIFARPKPGMTEQEFQRYWVEVHAVKYASKIAQIRRYLVDTRVNVGPPPEDPLFSGVAEIWLKNEQEQLASMQSPEFLEGARRDEPNWAAYWATLALDTTAHLLLEGPPLTPDPSWVKLLVLLKRKPGMPLDEFREYFLRTHGPLAVELPGIRRYMQCHVRDSFYAVGESRFDAVGQLWFDDVAAVEQMLRSPEFVQRVQPDLAHFVDLKYVFQMAVREHWVIGPEPRDYVPDGDRQHELREVTA